MELCLPALQLDSHWTEQADSPGEHGTCPITQGTLTEPQKALFTPAKRPQGEPWDNVYILHRNPASTATTFAYVLSVTFPTEQDIANCNAFEMDFQMNDGHTIYNWGWQFLIGTGLRIWDRSAGAWVKEPVLPFPAFAAGVPLRIVAAFSRNGQQLSYLGMGLNGVWNAINHSYSAIAEAQEPYLNNAWQLDSKGQGAPIACWLSECNVIGN